MKRAKAGLEIGIYALVGLALGAISFRQVVLSRFDLLLGDVGDARLIGVILEHWWQVFRGAAKWLSPPFFFPVQGVLGYGDALFLFALPYSGLRFVGLGTLVSYQIVLFAVVAAGWIGTILFFRRCVRLGVFATTMGAALFVFPNSISISPASHTQLFAIYVIPYLAIGIYVFVRDFSKSTPVGRAGGTLAAVLLPALFYTSYYIGWLSLFLLMLLAGVGYVWAWRHADGPESKRRILGSRANLKTLLPYCALSAVCFVPFAITYLPILRQFRGRHYSEIVLMLPSLVDFVNVGHGNWMWGRVLGAAFPGLGSRPMAHELVKGVPVCLLLVFVVSLFRGIRRVGRYRVRLAHEGGPNFLAEGKAISDDGRRVLLAAGLGTTVLLAWLLMLKIGDVSLWWVVAKVVPGASVIRAVLRFQHVLTFPLVGVVAIGLQQVVNGVRRGAGSRRKRNAKLAALAIGCLLLLAEQFKTDSVARYGKQQQRERLGRIHFPPPKAKVFALLPAAGLWQGPYEAAIDAMIIAQQYGLSTVNGYSGQLPRGGEGLYEIDGPGYLRHLIRWIRHYDLDIEGFYLLDAKTGVWSPATGLHALTSAEAALMAGPLADADFAFSLAAEDVPARWKKNEVKRCALRGRNNGGGTLSGMGNEFDESGKYAVRLSYRWVEVGRSVESLAGFDNRTGLPEAVKPKAEITMAMEIAAPGRPGKYTSGLA